MREQKSNKPQLIKRGNQKALKYCFAIVFQWLNKNV